MDLDPLKNTKNRTARRLNCPLTCLRLSRAGRPLRSSASPRLPQPQPPPTASAGLCPQQALHIGLFYPAGIAPPSKAASHLLVSFRSPGPLLRLLSGPIRALTRGSQPVKSHLSAVRTGLETPYTPLGRSPLLDHPPTTHTHAAGGGCFTLNVNGCLFGGRERKSRKKKS